jgi:hypothetical protein
MADTPHPVVPAETVDTPKPAQPARYDIGVLFVHGVGQQRRGQTLVAFGGAVHSWLSRWLGHAQNRFLSKGVAATREEIRAWLDGLPQDSNADTAMRRFEVVRPLLTRARSGGNKKLRSMKELSRQAGCAILAARVEFADVAMEAHDGDRDVPPQATLEITALRVDGKLLESRWLMAESWWAESFEPPRFGDLSLWGLLIVPSTIVSHFATRARRNLHAAREAGAPAGMWGLAALSLFLLFLCPLMALGAWVGLFVILLVAWIPKVRTLAIRAQQLLSGTIGDSYVLAARPLPAASILSRARRDLAWLLDKCDKGAAVAHSQGCAVVHLLLRSGVPDRLKVLLTFGSGLRKLEELRSLGSSERFAGFLAVFGLVTAAALGFYPGLWWPFKALGVVLGAMMVTTGCVSSILTDGPRDELDYWARLLLRKGLTWEDYYASADLIPNGSLFDRDPPLNSTIVHNRGSAWMDHTAYWNNQDEFVSAVAQEIARPTTLGLPQVSVKDKDVLAAAAARRRWRVRWLGWTRKAGFVLAATALVIKWKALGEAGRQWAEAIRYAGLEERWPASVMDVRSMASDPLWNPLVGLFVFVLTGFVTYLAVLGLWRIWDAEETDRFFGREDYSPASLRFGMFVTGISLAAVAAVSASWPGTTLAPWTATWLSAVVHLAIAALVAAILIMVARRKSPPPPPPAATQVEALFDEIPAYSPPDGTVGVSITPEQASALRAVETVRRPDASAGGEKPAPPERDK